MKPTDAELEVLQVLWEKGPSTVKTINEILCKTREVGYTTTLKIMQIMHEKGLLSRVKTGKTHTYTAEFSKESTQQTLVKKLVDTAFGGSASNLVMQILGNKQSSKSELEEIKKYLDHLEEKNS